ncbi:MAG: Calx-beta domain-containing protein [Thermomicrobiales bacterium]
MQTISPLTALPTINQPVIIDGYSQPGASANTLAVGDNAAPLIELNGSGAGGGVGVQIAASNSTIRGLIINRFSGGGIQILNGSASNTIAGNFIGTDATGATALPNGFGGVGIFGTTNNLIGGTTPDARNVISGNADAGIGISSPGTTDNLVQGNYIGTNAAGTAIIQNFVGIRIEFGASNNTIGGTTPGAGNTIAFNTGNGVVVGLDTGDTGATGNTIRANSIHDNARLGIDLGNDGVTANGINPRTFPNNGQNYPVLTTANLSGGNVTSTGTLTSTASTTFHLDFYANTAADPTGYGEGQTYLGSLAVTTNGTGNLAAPFTATFPIAPGQKVITATATNATTNDTSEFAQDIIAQPIVTIGNVSQNEGNSGTTPFVFTVTLSAASGQTVTVNYATADGTATTADNDYQAQNGALTFAPGVTTQTITVLINGDTKAEPDETFTVVLSSPANATIAAGGGIGSGTIINDDGGLLLSPTSLPNGTVGQPYSQQIVVSNGTAPYTFSLAGGTLPAGLTLGTDGKLAGTPTAANPFTFMVQAKDAGGVTGSQQYTVTINAAPVIVPQPGGVAGWHEGCDL